MNARFALILVVLLAVLGGAAVLFYQQERGRQAGNVGTLGQPVLKSLQAAEVASIRIVEPKSTLTVLRKDERWVIPERGGFPADVGKVREFVLQALSLKVGQSEPIGDKDRARLNLDASGTQVEFGNAEGKALATLTFQVEKVKTLELRYPDGGGWRIERDGDNADWRLAGLRPGEKLDVTKANAASYSLSLLELADVAPKDVSDTGLDKPTTIEATTLDGLAYSIKVGKLAGDNYYVSFTSSGAPAKDDKNVDLRKLLSQHVLLLPKAKLEDTLKKRPEMLETKDDAKK